MDDEHTELIEGLYANFCNKNIDALGLWNWEQERDAFALFCYFEGRKEIAKEKKTA